MPNSLKLQEQQSIFGMNTYTETVNMLAVRIINIFICCLDSVIRNWVIKRAAPLKLISKNNSELCQHNRTEVILY
jgi:hypothetical protein